MLKEQEKQELREYQVKLILMQKEKNTGHLSSEERDKITILVADGLSVRKIASVLGRSPSTISRELKRKEAVFFRRKYVGSQTHKLVKQYWLNSHKGKKLDNLMLRKLVEKALRQKLSPQIIAGRLKLKFGIQTSHETIYQYIYYEKNELTKYLQRRKYGRKHRQIRQIKQGTGKNIPNRLDIDLRSLEADLRSEIGHFEADSVESRKIRGKQLSCLTVMVDRASRKTIIRKTASKTSAETSKSIQKALKPYKNTIESITYDNGCEFSTHEKINKILNIKSYFCKPYHSWEKGTVENINGIIRWWYPKKTDFKDITEKELQKVENWINNRPMKVLGFKTPNEVFYEMKSVS